MNRRSIRFRLTVWYSLVLLLALGLCGGFVWLALRRELNARTDSALVARAQGVESTLRSLPAEDAASFNEEVTELSHSLPAGYLLEVIGRNDASIFTTPTAHNFFTPGWKPGYRSVEYGANLWSHTYLVRIAAPTTPTDDLMTQLGLLLLGTIPGVVVLAAAGGYWLSRRALAAVDDMTTAARSIGITNLSARLPVPEARDEIQRLAATWNEVLARLESAVSRINQFTSDASHELRTPIAFIRSTAEIAQRRPRTEAEYREALAQIETETERMTQLVEGLLFLARAEGKQALPELTPIDLRLPVKEACAEIGPIAFSKQIGFELDAGDAPLPVLGNGSALRRMALALLDNAVKYTPVGGTVSVQLGRSNGSARLAVRDTGAGIPEDALPHIFERFFRADPSRSRDSGGYGLGLSIVKTIAQQHSGSVSASSRPEKGSEFEVQLPICR